ncbi:hypothetical protein IYX23_05620 [Methylocystis sp. L43]|uniref:hypothetical protein n=1 Tax=unclassified Methylocystis TaxID=2625913 RepID=UPI0018C2CCC1|nr:MULTISPECIES: hypothetical protein [unclassified Methylocystis]MBG0797165.1 hypothetical protein [Methylocystis sp. L43]MBG0804964.1 hypothetical protein [Methylocystis sp. H15]
MAKRKISSDNFVAGLAAALGVGAGSVAREAVGRNLSADGDGDGIAEVVRWATENLDTAQLRALADALRDAADADNGRQAQDSAWRRPADPFEQRYPGSRRIGRPL